MRLVLGVGLAAAAAGVSPTAVAVPPAIHNLGTLGSAQSYGLGINEAGEVTGFVRSVDRAFRYTGTPGNGGTMQDLGVLAGLSSYGRAINVSGQVTGESASHAFLYTGTPGSAGTMADLGTLGGTASAGQAINASGQVAGSSTLAAGSGTRHAFLYTGVPGSGGTMADLGTLGGNESFAYGLNMAGQVTGSSQRADSTSHAFLYTGTPGNGGVMLDLGTLRGGEGNSQGVAINAAGQVTGYSISPDNLGNHAFLYTGTPGNGGVMLDLGTLGGTNSWGRAINSHGRVVGESQTVGNTDQHAFLYVGTPGAGGEMIDLDAWLDASNPTEGAKWTLKEGRGLTDSGLITGYGSYNDGPGGLSDGDRAFLLDASSIVPEPGGLSALLLGAMALLRRSRIRRSVRSSRRA